MLIDYHRSMLADRVRNEAFHAALKRVIRPGRTVMADVGSGTGLLSFMAMKLGAKECYLYEYSDLLKVSERLAKMNGIRGCHFIHSHSTKVKRPVPVDLIVSETLGNFAYEENIIEIVGDARRFLKPGGQIMPQRIEQFVAPVVAPRLYEELTVWDRVGLDIDFSLCREMSLNNLYVRTLQPADLLPGENVARRWDKVDLREQNRSQRRGNAQWAFKQPATLYGFALWWECELVEGITLSTSPHANRTHWEQLYAPVGAPLQVGPGDQLTLRLESDTRLQVGVNLRWNAALRRADGQVEEQQMDMAEGYLG